MVIVQGQGSLLMSKKNQDKKNNHLLRQAREQKGWSQERLAQELDVSPQTISRWECGTAFPYPHYREQLCQLFDKDIAALGLVQEKIEENNLIVSTSATKPFEATATPLDLDRHIESNDQQQVQSFAASNPLDQPVLTVSSRNRKRMLGRLRHAYNELLEHSLQETIWIELGLAGMPDSVQNATNRLVSVSQQDDQPLPSGTSIMDVYERSERELLILGAPGAGKSTMLLQLAQKLVQRAEREETHPLPVVLRLSSWAERQSSLEDWMGDQLALTYDISQKLSSQWVRNDYILPLLDGLDEMDEASRSACITALNAYHQEHLLVPLVICSRRAEYEDASRHEKLALQRAVLIQPLTLEQVSTSLEQGGPSLAILQQALHTNQALQELTRTPLMLSILMLTYSKTSAPALSHDASILQQQVWTDYVARMMAQKGDARQYPFRQTCSWLSWLAQNLKKHYQTVFYQERVDLDWLPDNLQRRAFWLSMRLPMVLIGILSSFVIGLFLQTVFDLTTGIQAAIIGALLGGCLSQPVNVGAEDSTSMGRKKHRPSVGKVLTAAGAGILLGLSFGFELGPGYGSGDWLRDGLIYGGIVGLVCWLLLAWLPFLPTRDGRDHPEQKPTLVRSLFFSPHLQRTLFGATILGLAYGLSTGLAYGLEYGPSAGLNIMMSYVCAIFIISLIVEKNKRDLSLTERLSWTWSSFLHSLRSFNHCATSVILAIGTLLLVGLSYGLTIAQGLQPNNSLGFRLSYGLSDGLTTGLITGPSSGLIYGSIMGLLVGVGTGLSYWLGVGLFQSIAREQIEDQDRQRLNQGVRRSALNSTRVGLLSGVLIGGLGFLGYGLSYWLNEALSKGPDSGLCDGVVYALGAVWLFALGGSLFGWAISGGWAVLQHFVLRWSLHRKHVFPWDTQGFLNDATARILLQRVGGGYSFIHRLLLEYFANLDDDSMSKLGSVTGWTKRDQ
jgi:transcriptional regulator with XRE-family HTH domain